jgi:hypothetical protein
VAGHLCLLPGALPCPATSAGRPELLPSTIAPPSAALRVRRRSGRGGRSRRGVVPRALARPGAGLARRARARPGAGEAKLQPGELGEAAWRRGELGAAAGEVRPALAGGGGGAARGVCGASRGGRGRSLAGRGRDWPSGGGGGAAPGRWPAVVLGVMRGWVGIGEEKIFYFYRYLGFF